MLAVIEGENSFYTTRKEEILSSFSFGKLALVLQHFAGLQLTRRELAFQLAFYVHLGMNMVVGGVCFNLSPHKTI